mgnify:CR=1 FL=1|jgi:hypothetical protein
MFALMRMFDTSSIILTFSDSYWFEAESCLCILRDEKERISYER